MVNNCDTATNASETGAISKQLDGKDCKRGSESSPESKKDCHNVVKSSGLGTKRRFCCEHGHRTKAQKVNVACQTDDASVGAGGNATSDATKISMTTTAAFDSPLFNSSAEPTLSSATALRVSAPQTSPKQDGEDGSKSEGTLRLMIHNFRNMNDTVRGPAKVINNIPWKIMVMPRQHVVAKKGTQKCLGFFLQCFPESYSDSWSCQAAAELRLISQKQGVPNFVRKTNHVYTAKENDWGYSCFMTWADILDESQGYMKDENVILEVYVKAEAPKGILTHDQFCKKIQDYMRLADMQCSRNLIDKALEVNQTALKFCKDKDETMKEDLEKQRARLIEQKLKQSIERIEKDVKPVENGETTLRQAITGNYSTPKGSGGGGGGSGSAKTPSSTTSTVPAAKEKPTAACTPKQGKDAGAAAKAGDSAKSPPASQLAPTSEETKLLNAADPSNVESPKARGREKRHKLPQVVDIDDPEAGTSDESDEESDYEDIDEVCDSCLVEKLENMSCGGGGGGNGVGVGTDSMPFPVETQENGCQTEPPIAKPRLPPIGANLYESKGSPHSGGGNNDDDEAIFAQQQQQQVENESQQQTNRGGGGGQAKIKAVSASTTTTTTTMPIKITASNENEQKLLQLITEESRASLNTIKDTLERLVLLAQDTTLPNNVQLELENVKSGATAAVVKQNLLNATGGGDVIKTDVVEIPPPAPVDGGGGKLQQHQAAAAVTAEENAKLVAMNNQLMAQQKRRQKQEQFGSIIAEELNESLLQDAIQRQQQRQHQQFVQTDLSFTPRANSPTEDRTLLARAQAIVENKAEELVTKYSQLIEQSEANRLAETVKKVEKRMKDIEKQTMTCRKELSDECERHYREEQKLIKANKQLKQQLDQANEKVEKLNGQLKEKRVEVKKLEKRLKAECQSSAENAELNSKIEQLERDLATTRQKHSEEKQRWNDETQKFHEMKRSLQQEISFTTADVERLHTQLEEKSASIRKLENNLKLERQHAQSAQKETTERAKKAEVSLLEMRLDTGTKSLQRALDECQSHVAQLEDAAKRFTRMQMNEEARTSNSCLQEWRKTRDKIQELVQKAKIDFGQQIDAVKGGKSLASLPTLDVPRPPPPPATPKLLLSVQTPPEQRQQHIAPIGTSATGGSKGAATPSSQSQHQPQPQVTPPSQSQQSVGGNGVGGGGSVTSGQRAPSVPPSSAAVCNGPAQHHGHGQSSATPTSYQTQAAANAQPQTPNASGVVPARLMSESTGASTPSSFEQAVSFAQQQKPPSSTIIAAATSSSSSTAAGQPASASGPNPSSMSASSSLVAAARSAAEICGVQSSSSSGPSDFTPWATDPLNIMHTLIGAKGGFNISGFDGGLNAHSHSHPPLPPSSSMSSATASSSSSGQSGNHELMNGGFGMHVGGAGSGTPSGRGGGHDGQGQWSSGNAHHYLQQQHQQQWTQQSPAALRSSASSRSQGNNSPPQAYNGRSDSPNEKKLEALAEQLRNVFPNLSPEFVRESVYEFRHYAKNFKSMPLDQLINPAVGFLFSRQQHAAKMSNWGSNTAGVVGGNYESGGGGGHGPTTNTSTFMGGDSNEEPCAICGYGLRLQPMCSLPSCSHVFHSACAAQWLLSHRACPTCGVFALPPEEYPDLS